jgi:hypothetical protein
MYVVAMRECQHPCSHLGAFNGYTVESTNHRHLFSQLLISAQQGLSKYMLHCLVVPESTENLGCFSTLIYNIPQHVSLAN